MRSTILTTALAIAASAAAPAVAQTAPTDAVAVEYGDLDLSNEADARKLDRRLRNAAREVCGTSNWVDRFCISNTYKDARATLKARTSVALAATK
jgi:UrcA family protein